MNTHDFLKALEDQSLISPDVLQKLHSKIDNTDKKVSAKSIAKYLIDKGYLSLYQAKQLLASKTEPLEKLPPEDDMEVAVPPEQLHDTGELLKDLQPKSSATRADDAVASVQPGEFEQSIEVVDVEHELTQMIPPGPAGLPTDQPHAVPHLGDPLGGGFDSLAYEQDAADEGEVDLGFAGKRTVKNQWESKWLFIGSGLLGVFIIVGIILWYTLFKTDAEKLWAEAVEEFTNQRYQTAMEQLHRFVKSYPSEERAPMALVYIANCELRQSYDTRSWDTTLERIKSVLPRLQGELDEYQAPEKFDSIRDELSVILPGTGLGFTENAIKAPTIEDKQALLAKAYELKEQIGVSAYMPTSQLRKPGVADVITDFENNIAIVERQIQMEKDYVAALDDIEQLTRDGKTKVAFEKYYTLIAEYSELANRQPLEDAIAAISKREADLVNTIDFETTAAADVATAIKSSVVVATKSGGAKIPGLNSEMIVYLVNGALYGVRAADGQIVWRHYVGTETSFLPAWVDEAYLGDVIAADQRLNQIMRIQSSDGQIKWRTGLGEPFNEPIVEADAINVTTTTGKVMQLDPDTGTTQRAAQIPQQASVSGVTNGKDPYIYQVGRNGNLYVISTETLSCREVFYVGHRPDSVTVPPFILSGHILVAENGPNYCNIHVIAATENGLKLVEAQKSRRLSGQVTTRFVRYGRWGLVLSDKDDLRMLEVNLASEDEPVTEVVTGRFSRDRQTDHYLLAADGQLWTAGSGIRRYRIQKAAGRFDRQEIQNNLDTFLGPVEKIGDTLFHIRRRHASALISISAVDATSLKEKWRTDFAAPLAGPPISSGDSVLVVSSQGDLFDVDAQTFERGVTDEPLARGSTVAQNLVFDQLLAFDQKRYVATGPLDKRNIMAIDEDQTPPNKLSDLQRPADQPSCRPVTFGDTLLVASLRGQVIRINPRNGRAIGAPFQPPLEPNVKIQWRRPAVITQGEQFMIADATGRFFNVVADGEKALQKVDEYQHNGTVQSGLVNHDGVVYAVCREDLSDKIIALPAGQKIEVTLNTPLPGGYVAGPMVIDDMILVAVDSGDLVCFDGQLQQKWAARLPLDKMVGEPQMIDGAIVIAFESGAILHINPQNGETTENRHVGQPIAFPPTQIGDRIYVTGADGTLHLMNN